MSLRKIARKKLRDRIKFCGFEFQQVASELGVTKETFSRKMNDESYDFNESEIVKLSLMLDMPVEQIVFGAQAEPGTALIQAIQLLSRSPDEVANAVVTLLTAGLDQRK